MAVFSPGLRRSALAEKLKLFFREPTIDTNSPIASGIVPIEGFDVEFVHSVSDADVWDCGFAARLQKMERERCVSVPAFPNRKFRLSYIFVNAEAGIHAPADLQESGLAYASGQTLLEYGRAEHFGITTTSTSIASNG